MTRGELLACLTDRPCTVCKYHKENGCCKWNCVFEEEPTDTDDFAIQYARGFKDGFKQAQDMYKPEGR